ncbi:hypothetical protein NQ317_006535 [Molorchus minor]|uniref:Uncharacterized protein n=1 Tax=Molorchus minor TaxID=1323400 RepID=A0ABQ9J976_9CUCU|nr:hypothetical protein NQ317_006535 [Molorchus minor]
MLEVRKSGAYKKTLPGEPGHGYSNGAEKRNRVDDKGQPSIRDPLSPRKIAQVASLKHQSNSIFIDALVDDFKQGVLQINEEEVVLHGRTEERVRVVLAEDSSISERCEAILYACPDGRYDEGSIMMVEPGTHDSEGGHGVVIGRACHMLGK